MGSAGANGTSGGNDDPGAGAGAGADAGAGAGGSTSPSLSFSVWMRSSQGAAIKQLLALPFPFAHDWDLGERLSAVFFMLNAVSVMGEASPVTVSHVAGDKGAPSSTGLTVSIDMLRAELESRYTDTLTFNYDAHPLPKKLHAVLCGESPAHDTFLVGGPIPNLPRLR